MLEDLKPVKKIGTCKVRTVAEGLSDKDKKLFYSYINDEDTWSAHTLSKALLSRDVNLDPKAIMRHRVKGCTCRLVNGAG
jgi:hypothetical protein